FDVPVVDITEAAAATAMFVGHRYSVVTTLERAVPMIEARLKLAGLAARCASVRAASVPVLALEQGGDDVFADIAEEALAAIENDHCEVICLGCGGMAGLAQRLGEAVGVPVVDGVSAAVTLAEGLVHQGLSTSKIGMYAPPPAKSFKNWPPRL